MLRFIIDGYNLLSKIPRCKGLSLRRQRQLLIILLETFKAGMSQRNRVMVVFDGKSQFSFDQGPQGRVAVIFSKDEEADALIKRMIDEDASPKSLVIISDDKEIIGYARAQGSRHEAVADFLRRAGKKRLKPSLDDDIKLDCRKAGQVNQEIKGLWQKKYL